MKKFRYIFVLLMLTSCSSNRTVIPCIINDKEAEKYQHAFRRSKEEFLLLDSASSIMQDLGWAKRIIKEAKISGNTIPSVFKCINDDGFTLELPCWEFDTLEYKSVSVIVEHHKLDSALVKAKIQGVDDIFKRSEKKEKFSWDEKGDYYLDSIEYIDSYADYMATAKFTCLCITKVKNKYIVNATIRKYDGDK